ncbi:MAG TPA: hypothetical protein VEV84_12740 [Pyrinomonadaceae bacterium]|nr:hypothetical protein [Pyrinomonadaceae bacterium]
MTPDVPQDELNAEPAPEEITVVEPVEPAAVEPVAELSAEPVASNQKTNPNPWKTAFIILVGIVLLSGIMIYSTSVKQTDPTTVLQTDANGQPVQPLNPASGADEERLASMPPDTAAVTNSNTALSAGQLPGGDGYNAWANGGAPPPGAPKIGPGGQYVTVPNGGSQFMPPDCILQPSGIYLCPVPVTNTNTAVKPTPTPKVTPQNANVQPSPTPVPTAPKATPSPAGAKPTPTPRTRSTPAKPSTTKSPEETN